MIQISIRFVDNWSDTGTNYYRFAVRFFGSEWLDIVTKSRDIFDKLIDIVIDKTLPAPDAFDSLRRVLPAGFTCPPAYIQPETVYLLGCSSTGVVDEFSNDWVSNPSLINMDSLESLIYIDVYAIYVNVEPDQYNTITIPDSITPPPTHWEGITPGGSLYSPPTVGGGGQWAVAAQYIMDDILQVIPGFLFCYPKGIYSDYHFLSHLPGLEYEATYGYGERFHWTGCEHYSATQERAVNDENIVPGLPYGLEFEQYSYNRYHNIYYRSVGPMFYSPSLVSFPGPSSPALPSTSRNREWRLQIPGFGNFSLSLGLRLRLLSYQIFEVDGSPFEVDGSPFEVQS